ncbi:MAG: stage IV sporulation protein A [Firmicutes bacterium]|nr:stage IV sporulation protein A [Bacillota bacterium]
MDKEAKFDIYKDIRERTNGDIYIGVVGPVRVGKSTFITQFMEKLVVPNTGNKHVKERMKDELPQSAAGKTIMTTQPKFVPAEAVAIKLGDGIDMRIRLVDCVGYLVSGAEGHMDDGKKRMVKTPWSDSDMSFEDAAEFGTRKVITDHATIGIVMTTDGSINTDISRSAYVPAEERVVSELKAINKPFVIVVNSTVPTSNETKKLVASLTEKYQNAVIALDVAKLSGEDVGTIMERLLFEFPLRGIDIEIDKWLQALPATNRIIGELSQRINECSSKMTKMSDYILPLSVFEDSEIVDTITTASIRLGTGKITYEIKARKDLFFRALSEESKHDIADEYALMSFVKHLSHAKHEYDKISAALEEVKITGYGVVTPTLDDMQLEEPEIVRQGSRYGVKLKASAPSLHIMQVDIKAEVSPAVGTEQQSEELVRSLLSQFESDPKSLWETKMFGKSLHVLVNDGLNNKITAMPIDTQRKMRRTLSRIVNEGKGGVICILL